jgi:nitroreductase
LCRVWNLDESLVDNYIDDTIEKTGATKEDLAGYTGMMKGFMNNMDEAWLQNWADKQIYIALGNIMTCLALMEIDACPMEGFINEKYDEVLWLKEKNLSSVLLLPIGYRHMDDVYATKPKIRYNEEKLFTEI